MKRLPPALAIILSAILLSVSGARARPPTGPQPEGGCPAWNGESGDVAAQWGAPTRTPGCWFFSGPGELGRDDHLGARARWSRQGDAISRVFGSARFEGRLEGRRVRLTRASTHQAGSPWRVTETITGELRETNGCTTFVGRYHYDECEQGASCPGQCHIDADLRLTRR